MRIVTHSLLTLAFAAALACGPKEVVEPPPPPPDQKAPEFEGGGQHGVVGEEKYPGPYGIGIGSVIPNYQFYGFPNADVDATTMVLIELADFYNPTGDGVYPAGSPFGEGNPKPKAILLDRSARWCGPCQSEAANVIPTRRAQYAPLGEFFVTLDDGAVPGDGVAKVDLEWWTGEFPINYPAVIDPTSTLSAVVGRDAYPGNVILRTRDMKIIDWNAGVPPSSFWQTFEAVMNDQPVLPGD